MSATTELLDKAKAVGGLTSDGQLAKWLKWPRGTVASYRSGSRVMGVEAVAEFSPITGISLETIIAATLEDKKSLRSQGTPKSGQRRLELIAA